MSGKLKEVLKGLNKGELTEKVALKEVEKETLSELSAVEQELLAESLATEKLRGFL